MAKKNRQLLVEGNDDLHVIASLCKKFDIPETFEIIDCQGIEKLLVQIPVRLKQSDFKALGIIIDADSDIEARWERLKSIFGDNDIILPKNIPNDGLITNAKGINIGIWIMPNNNTNGMLEDFISFLVPKEDKLLPFASKTLDAIEEEKLNQYIGVHKSKALIHSWLSWQQDPGTPMGLAITKKFLTTEDETCTALINWLSNTFEEN